MHRNKRTVWYLKNGKKITKSAPKFPKKVMVWRAISVRGFYLKIVDGPGNINGPKYCHILGKFLPYDALFPEGWILQQDGARPHTSNFTKNWMEDNHDQTLQWPPNSAKLSLKHSQKCCGKEITNKYQIV